MDYFYLVIQLRSLFISSNLGCNFGVESHEFCSSTSIHCRWCDNSNNACLAYSKRSYHLYLSLLGMWFWCSSLLIISWSLFWSFFFPSILDMILNVLALRNLVLASVMTLVWMPIGFPPSHSFYPANFSSFKIKPASSFLFISLNLLLLQLICLFFSETW